MQNSKICPKCQEHEIIRIPGEARAFGAGNNILVGGTIFSAAKVTRYLCASCGFSEEWVESADDIARIQEKLPCLSVSIFGRQKAAPTVADAARCSRQYVRAREFK